MNKLLTSSSRGARESGIHIVAEVLQCCQWSSNILKHDVHKTIPYFSLQTFSALRFPGFQDPRPMWTRNPRNPSCPVTMQVALQRDKAKLVVDRQVEMAFTMDRKTQLPWWIWGQFWITKEFLVIWAFPSNLLRNENIWISDTHNLSRPGELRCCAKASEASCASLAEMLIRTSQVGNLIERSPASACAHAARVGKGLPVSSCWRTKEVLHLITTTFSQKKNEETQEIIRHHGIKRLAVCLTFWLRNIENWEPQTREWHLDCGSAPRAKASLKTEAPLVKPISRTKTKQKHRVN